MFAQAHSQKKKLKDALDERDRLQNELKKQKEAHSALWLAAQELARWVYCTEHKRQRRSIYLQPCGHCICKDCLSSKCPICQQSITSHHWIEPPSVQGSMSPGILTLSSPSPRHVCGASPHASS